MKQGKCKRKNAENAESAACDRLWVTLRNRIRIRIGRLIVKP